MSEVSAIIIARSGSVRIKDKSMLSFGGGDNLITHKIKQLKKSELVDRIVFGSDSEAMLSAAEKAGAEVFKRSDYFCDEQKSSINEVIYDMCSKISTDIVVWAHCTNPLLSADTYSRAIRTFMEKKNEGYDSLLSVFELREHLWGADKNPLNYNPYQKTHPLAKTLPPLYMQDGGIFIQPHANMLKNSYFFGENPYLFCIPENEFADINTYKDYISAKAFYDFNLRNDV